MPWIIGPRPSRKQMKGRWPEQEHPKLLWLKFNSGDQEVLHIKIYPNNSPIPQLKSSNKGLKLIIRLTMG